MTPKVGLLSSVQQFLSRIVRRLRDFLSSFGEGEGDVVELHNNPYAPFDKSSASTKSQFLTKENQAVYSQLLHKSKSSTPVPPAEPVPAVYSARRGAATTALQNHSSNALVPACYQSPIHFPLAEPVRASQYFKK